MKRLIWKLLSILRVDRRRYIRGRWSHPDRREREEGPGDQPAMDRLTLGLLVFALFLVWVIMALWVPGPF